MKLKIENNLHHLIGGNNRNIPDDIKLSLFKGFPKNSIAKLLLEIAIQSSFDGLQDLKKWKTIGLINAETWTLIEEQIKSYSLELKVGSNLKHRLILLVYSRNRHVVNGIWRYLRDIEWNLVGPGTRGNFLFIWVINAKYRFAL